MEAVFCECLAAVSDGVRGTGALSMGTQHSVSQSSSHHPCSASLPVLHLSPLCSGLISLSPSEGLQWVTQFAGLESTVLL